MVPWTNVISLTCGFGLFVLAEAASAQEKRPADDSAPLTEIKIVERVNVALDKSLAYLVSKHKADGSWADNHACNAMPILAFMGRGHVPGRGPHRETLEKTKRFILATQSKEGVFASPRPSHGPMYEHALCTLALSEMYGVDPDVQLESKLRKAVELIVRSQANNGGWRYQPHPGDHDLSVSVMQIVALRAANNAEIPVPAKTITEAIKYVKSCEVPSGGFAYQPGGGANPQMTAAGILSLQLLGRYDDPSVNKALNTLEKLPVQWGSAGQIQYFYYFHYYAIQGHYQAGGQYWNSWHPRVREMLLEKQNKDGSWDCPGGTAEANEGTVGPNKVYWTAMASLVLEIYMHFLPAYQR